MTNTPNGPAPQNIFQSDKAGQPVVLKTPPSQKTNDGFKNFALKLGVSSRGEEGNSDNAISDGFYAFNLITRNRVQLEAAYRGSWIVGRVINCFAEDMTRAGITLNTNKGAEKVSEFKVQMSRLQIWQSFFETIAWSRLYGGAIGVLQIEGQDLKSPLRLETVQKDQFKGIATYDRWQLNPSMSQIINSGPNIGLPEYYDIALGSNQNDPGLAPLAKAKESINSSGGLVKVHHSRCIRLIGIKLPYWQAITEMMWGESCLERLWDRLIEFDTATAAAGSLITRANLRTVSIDGLREILAAGGKAEEALISQFEYMRKFQSSEGLTLLDKEDNFQSTAYSFAGLSDVILQLGQQVSGSSEIPLVRLFGQAPAGLNATGESDIRNYYDSVAAKQEATLRNPIELIIRVMWRSCFGEAAPDDLAFTFTPLWQMSATDKATIATQNTAAIVQAHDDGLLSTSTAMKELKQQSIETGLFTHITDEDIEGAEEELPPEPVAAGDPEKEGQETGNLGNGPTVPKEKTGDNAWKRIKAFMTKERHVLPKKRTVDAPKPKKRVMTKDQKRILEFIK